MLRNYRAQYPSPVHRYLRDHVASSLARGRVSRVEVEDNRDGDVATDGASRYRRHDRQSRFEFVRFKSLPDLVRDMEPR